VFARRGSGDLLDCFHLLVDLLLLLPSSSTYTIRPFVFVMASLIARGDRISLAVPVLANIYRCLRGLTSSCSPSQCQELIPWHLISGWLHMHWSGSYDPDMAVTL
jgi:hypothetical protein